jgi:glycosyltransferase involved in cell wall biosynthesis
MKVMLQNHTFYPILGGIENYLYYVATTLREMGHQPIIFCEKHDPGLSDCETYEGIRVLRHPYYSVPKPILFLKPKIVSDNIRRYLAKHVADMDLVISRYPHYCYATCSLRTGIPVVYIPATVYWNYLVSSSKNSVLKTRFFNYLWKPVFDHLENKSIILADKVVTLSEHISTSLTHYYRLNQERIVTNRSGVDTHRFNNLTGGEEVRSEYDIPEDSVVVLSVVRLSSEKNVARLLEEFKGLRRRGVRLLIVGDGPERGRLERLTRELELGGLVIFAGFRKDVERFYAASDIFTLPSRYEAFGQVILEAMAAGLPCVAFKKVLPAYEVASEELIRDGFTGFCVDPYDEGEFREKLLYLVDNPHMREKMGAEGRKICTREFTWEGHVKRLLNLLGN